MMEDFSIESDSELQADLDTGLCAKLALKCDRGVQGLQLFSFCVININEEHTKNLGSNETLGAIFKDGICAKLCLKLWFESYFNFL